MRISLDTPVDSAAVCVRCNYELRGLRADGDCPECGYPVGRSLSASAAGALPRWRGRALVAVILAAISFVLFGASTCGCHFSPEAFAASLIFPSWGVWTLLTYRTWGERVVAWVVFVVSMLWMGFSVMANGLMY